MTNRWNRFFYRLWAPIYDSTVNHFFMPGRKRALELLGLQPGEKVLLIGVGTGAGLPFLPVVWTQQEATSVRKCMPKPASKSNYFAAKAWKFGRDRVRILNAMYDFRAGIE